MEGALEERRKECGMKVCNLNTKRPLWQDLIKEIKESTEGLYAASKLLSEDKLPDSEMLRRMHKVAKSLDVAMTCLAEEQRDDDIGRLACGVDALDGIIDTKMEL